MWVYIQRCVAKAKIPYSSLVPNNQIPYSSLVAVCQLHHAHVRKIPGSPHLFCTASDEKLGGGLGTRLSLLHSTHS